MVLAETNSASRFTRLAIATVATAFLPGLVTSWVAPRRPRRFRTRIRRPGSRVESNHAFVDAYIAAGRRNAVFNFPDGIHSWGYAGHQVQQMMPDIQRTLGVTDTART